jgi:hypothetical protein
MDAAVELDAQPGAQLPPAKRVKLSPSPSPPFEFAEYSEEDSDGPGPDSPESLVLDLFQIEGSEESNHGIDFDIQNL